MNKVIIALCSLILLTAIGCDVKQPPQVTTALEKAPDFALKELSGKEIKLTDLIGAKPIVLDFWASWCSYCREAIPDIIELHNQHKDKITVVGINLDRTLGSAQRYTSEHNIPYLNLYDEGGQVANAYGVHGIPHIIIINSKGEILKRNATIDDIRTIVK
ncbi:MAG: TlpA disulfide reductase family protein [Planctomycetota bacterium]